MKKSLFLVTTFVSILGYAQVGINTPNPTATLDVVAKEVGKGFRLQDGNQGNNKVLMSDANGIGTWKDLNIPAADSNFKLARVYSVRLDMKSTSDAIRTALLGSIPNIEVTKPDNFIICNIQSPATIVNSTLQSIAYAFELDVDNAFYESSPTNIISNIGFTDATQNSPYSFYLNQYPVGNYKFDIYGARYNSNGSNAASRLLYFNAIGATNGTTATEKKGLAIVYVYEK